MKKKNILIFVVTFIVLFVLIGIPFIFLMNTTEDLEFIFYELDVSTPWITRALFVLFRWLNNNKIISVSFIWAVITGLTLLITNSIINKKTKLLAWTTAGVLVLVGLIVGVLAVAIYEPIYSLTIF